METLYRIEELATTGWSLIEPEYKKLTKQQCIVILNRLMNEGYSPERLRAVRDEMNG